MDENLTDHIRNFNTFLEQEKIKFDINWGANIMKNNEFDNFNFLKTIARGRFSNVCLVSHKVTNEISALKIIKKEFLIKHNLVNSFKNEIKISNALNFPFLLQLSYFFKDNIYLYLGFPLVNGGDLFDALNIEIKFNEEIGKFFSSQILLALEYLHYMGVIYRDLKLENILITYDGYLKLTDYGFSKKINDTRTYTLCGTPEYIAPEILLNKGYNYSADWWSFGILLFELMAGITPFYDENPICLYDNILNLEYTMPQHFSKELKHLLSNIIIIDMTKRFGCLADGTKNIKEHPWYSNINWEQILTKQINSAYKPKVSTPDDINFFTKKPTFVLEVASNNLFDDEFTEF